MSGMLERSPSLTPLFLATLIAGAGCTRSLSVEEFQQRYCERPPGAGSVLCTPPKGEVELIGTLGASLGCTKMACPESDPCCNECTGAPMLRADEPGSGISLEVPGVSCHTVGCDVFCNGLEPGKRYRVRGSFASKWPLMTVSRIERIGD